MEELLRLGKIAKYKKGEILIRPTDIGGELFIINKGLVHAYTIEESGEKNIHIIYGPGEAFPLAWLIRKEPLAVYYESLSSCEVVKVAAHQAVELLKSDASASFEMLCKVIQQFVAYKARVDNLEYKFARERVAYTLLLLARRFGDKKDGTITLPKFSHEEIGQAINVSRESVGRELKRFEKYGFIRYSPGKLKIIDETGLHKEVAPANTPLFIDDI